MALTPDQKAKLAESHRARRARWTLEQKTRQVEYDRTRNATPEAKARNVERSRVYRELHPITPDQKARKHRVARAYRASLRGQAKQLDRLVRKYDLSVEDYDAMLIAQGGRCAVCHVPTLKPCVDHDHRTGKVRGLLCHGCNKAAGFLDDNPAYAASLANYLSVGKAP